MTGRSEFIKMALETLGTNILKLGCITGGILNTALILILFIGLMYSKKLKHKSYGFQMLTLVTKNMFKPQNHM